MKTLVIGLGNPILGDDGIGWKVAEEVKKQLSPSPIRAAQTSQREWSASEVDARVGGKEAESHIDVDFLSLGGISLMEHLIGYERAILIDALVSGQKPGSVTVSKLSEMPDFSALHTTSAHDTSLQNALKLGEGMGAKLPGEVLVVGIATNRVYDFSEELSAPVANAVPEAAKTVLELLKP